MLPQQALLNTKAPAVSQDVSAATLSEVPAEQQGQSFSDLMTQQNPAMSGNSIKGEKTEANTGLSVQPVRQASDAVPVQLTPDMMLAQAANGATNQDRQTGDPDLLLQSVQGEEKDGQELPLDIQVQQIIDQQTADKTDEEQSTLLPPDGNSLPSDNNLVYAQPMITESKGSTPQGDFQKNKILGEQKPNTILNYVESQKIIKQESQAVQNPSAQQTVEQFIQQSPNNHTGAAISVSASALAEGLNKKNTESHGKLAISLNNATNGINLQDVSAIEESEGLLKNPVDSKHIEKAIGQRIQLMIQQGKQVAEIRIDPPQLGKIDISLQNSHQQLSVHMVADNPQVREMLAQSIDRLQQQLAQDQSTQVQVSVSSQGQQNAQSQQEAENVFNNGVSASSHQEQEEEQISSNTKPLWVSNTLVDVYS